MKKIIFTLIITVLACFTSFACTQNNEPQIYTIQYHDGVEIKTISVKDGDLFNITVPTKAGYDFKGLYDEEYDGSQLVDENGCSISGYAEKKNITLYAYYEPKTYTVVLDYQGAEVNSIRSMEVKFGNQLNVVPTEVSLENKEFVGWFTQPNCQGNQIADKYGLLPTANKLTATNFTIPSDEFVYLYAGFKTVQHKLTLYFGSDYYPEEVMVDHGTNIKDVIPERRVNDMAVLTWSQMQNDVNKAYLFNGTVSQNMTLYACDYAPVIDFDTKGGDNIKPLVAKSGVSVTLPVPTRANYKFIEWRDENGNSIEISKMPSKSMKITAFWHSKLIFDENGGTEVQDIVKEGATKIYLPTTTKEGYIFAGWYDENGEKFEQNTMPLESACLKAGWYKEKRETIHIIDGTTCFENAYDDFKMDKKYALDMSSVLPAGFEGSVKINAYFTAKHELAYSIPVSLYLNFYSQDLLSDNYLLASKSFSIVSWIEYEPFEYSFSAYLKGTKIYCAPKMTITSRYTRISDYYFEVIYPDVNSLIL